MKLIPRVEREKKNDVVKRSMYPFAPNAESKAWRAVVSTALAAAVIGFSSSLPASADLNKYEAETRGEFGIGSAAQFGSADLRSKLL